MDQHEPRLIRRDPRKVVQHPVHQVEQFGDHLGPGEPSTGHHEREQPIPLS